MRTALLVLALSLAGSGTAFAQQAAAPPPPPPTMHGGGGMIGALMSADTNGDGIITREELLASSDAMFARLDTNHDGVISPDEMQAGRPMRRGGTPPSGDLGATPPPPAPPGPGGTGMTRQQWHDRALRQFDRIDANHDGRIDQTEIANYREAMRQRRMERRGGGDMPPPPAAGATPPPAADQQ